MHQLRRLEDLAQAAGRRRVALHALEVTVDVRGGEAALAPVGGEEGVHGAHQLVEELGPVGRLGVRREVAGRLQRPPDGGDGLRREEREAEHGCRQ